MTSKAVFLDRDDTLINDTGYLNDPEQVQLLEGVPQALRRLRQMDYKLIVVSNQSGVARGIVTEEVLGQIHQKLEQLLAQRGARLDKIYYCPYLAEGAIPKYRKDSDLRKPNPGMLLKASRELNIDLEKSWMIGDSIRDVQAGQAAGCRTILIEKIGEKDFSKIPEKAPDHKAVNITEATNIIRQYQSAQKHGINPFAQPRQSTSQDIPTSPSKSATPEKKEQSNQSNSDKMSCQQNSEKIKAQQTETTSETSEPSDQQNDTLQEILNEIKKQSREDMFGEDDFSVMRLLAGIIQVVVLFCLLLAIWFLLSPQQSYQPVLTSLGFAATLQIMALTFYTMQGRW